MAAPRTRPWPDSCTKTTMRCAAALSGNLTTWLNAAPGLTEPIFRMLRTMAT